MCLLLDRCSANPKLNSLKPLNLCFYRRIQLSSYMDQRVINALKTEFRKLQPYKTEISNDLYKFGVRLKTDNFKKFSHSGFISQPILIDQQESEKSDEE